MRKKIILSIVGVAVIVLAVLMYNGYQDKVKRERYINFRIDVKSNPESFVHIELPYTKRLISGVKNGKLIVSNPFGYNIQLITITVLVLKDNGEAFSVEDYTFIDLFSGQTQERELPDYERGSSVEYKIKNMRIDKLQMDL